MTLTGPRGRVTGLRGTLADAFAEAVEEHQGLPCWLRVVTGGKTDAKA